MEAQKSGQVISYGNSHVGNGHHCIRFSDGSEHSGAFDTKQQAEQYMQDNNIKNTTTSVRSSPQNPTSSRQWISSPKSGSPGSFSNPL